MVLHNTLRHLLGLCTHSTRPKKFQPGDIEAGRPQTGSTEALEPYHGMSVPQGASHDPSDSEMYDEWSERYFVVPAIDPSKVLVFCKWFEAENAYTGEVQYDEWMNCRGDDDEVERLESTNKIYQHMFDFPDALGHPRIVRYFGATPTGYLLERLHPGPAYPRDLVPTKQEVLLGDGNASSLSNDAILALHQRWALQVLNALSYIHNKGVILNGVIWDALWLREDFSIAVAGFVAASSKQLGIGEGHWFTSTHEYHSNPWST
ncbi:hypothetical protein LTS10_011763 [Elasticomyces elasticus]|nr:hypothetical protein LTS10_011763 [Elasticomyces elasticus]